MAWNQLCKRRRTAWKSLISSYESLCVCVPPSAAGVLVLLGFAGKKKKFPEFHSFFRLSLFITLRSLAPLGLSVVPEFSLFVLFFQTEAKLKLAADWCYIFFFFFNSCRLEYWKSLTADMLEMSGCAKCDKFGSRLEAQFFYFKNCKHRETHETFVSTFDFNFVDYIHCEIHQWDLPS